MVVALFGQQECLNTPTSDYCSILLKMAFPSALASTSAYRHSPSAGGEGVEEQPKKRKPSLAQKIWGVVSDDKTKQQALQAATYTGVVNVLICLFVGVLIATYLVLQSFLKPLLWASLCGVVLFPFKCKSTAVFAGWLSRLERERMPLLVGMCLLPFHLFALLSNRCEQIIFKWKRLTVVIVVYAASVWMFYNSPVGKSLQSMYSVSRVYVRLSEGWSTCVESSQSIVVFIQHWINIWWLIAGLLVMQAPRSVYAPLQRIHIVLSPLSLLLKLSFVLHLSLYIFSEGFMVLALSTLFLIVLLLASIALTLALFLVTILFIFVQLSIVYGMVWLVVKVTELILTPCGLNVWVQPLSRRLLALARLVWSIALRTLGPLMVLGLRAVGGGSTNGDSSTEQGPEEDISSAEPEIKEEVDLPTNPTALDSLSIHLWPESTRHKDNRMRPSALRQRTSSAAKGSWQAHNSEEDELSQSWSSSFRSASLRRLSVRFANKIEEFVVEDERESGREEAEEVVDGEVDDDGYGPGDQLSRVGSTGKSNIEGENPRQCSSSEDSDSEPLLHSGPATPRSSTFSVKRRSFDTSSHPGGPTKAKAPPKEAAKHYVQTIFQVLAGAFVLTLFLTHHWTALLFVLMVGWIMVKSAMGGLLEALLCRVWSNLQTVVDSNIPSPVKKMYLLLDRKVISYIQSRASSLVSIFIIILLLLAAFSLPLLLAFELYSETFHYLSVTGELSERVMSRAGFNVSDSQRTVEGMMAEVYGFTRQWMEGQIDGLMPDKDAAERSQVTAELLHTLDAAYAEYFNHSNQTLLRHQRTKPSSSPWSSLQQLVVENTQTVKSVLQSASSVIAHNIHIFNSVLKSCTMVILNSGQAVFGFLFSALIFLWTLFYLLSASGKQFLLVEKGMKLIPHQLQLKQKSTEGQQDLQPFLQAWNALASAYQDVFEATFKMALFYSLYTWTLHKLFSMEAAILPAAIAGMAAVVPLVSPYVAALPAVVELLIVDSDWLTATLLFLLHLLPSFFVDAAIYSEIEGAHPHLAALAIAGGAYLAGLEGAILGPLLLCTIKFFVNIYTVTIAANIS